jgi:hypothetical protein
MGVRSLEQKAVMSIEPRAGAPASPLSAAQASLLSASTERARTRGEVDYNTYGALGPGWSGWSWSGWSSGTRQSGSGSGSLEPPAAAHRRAADCSLCRNFGSRLL